MYKDSMCKKTKILKYKVVNTNIDKSFIGKKIDLERVESKGRSIIKPRTKPPVWFIEFEKRNNQKFEKIDEKFEQIDKKFEKIDQRFEKMDKRLDRLEKRFDRTVRVNNLKN